MRVTIGVGWLLILQLAFIALKLTGGINWAWPVVLTPAIVYTTILMLAFLAETLRPRKK